MSAETNEFVPKHVLQMYILVLHNHNDPQNNPKDKILTFSAGSTHKENALFEIFEKTQN